MKRIDENGEIFIEELRNEIISDYILYRVCEINNQPLPHVNSYYEIYSTIDRLSTSQDSINYMQSNNPMSGELFSIERLVKTLYKEFELNCIIKEDFNWIDNSNKRLVCFIWKLLNNLSPMPGTDLLSINLNPIAISNLNEAKITVKMDHVSIGSVSKKNIIHFINRLKVNKTRKIELLGNINCHAAISLNDQRVYKWLNKDLSIKMPWVQEYLYATMPGCIPTVIPGSNSVELEIVSFFDVLNSSNADKFKLLAINMKKAWSQRTHRGKNKTKKQYSINMSNDIGGILDELSIKKNENKNAIVEALIRAEQKKYQTIEL